MKKWAYVICELCDEHGKPTTKTIAEGGMPSFRHTFVEAEDASGAYKAGHHKLRQPRGNGLNDYVFELP
mgnify:CR=1 FL=1